MYRSGSRRGTGSARDWTTTQQIWSSDDRLIAVDLSGHGSSSPLSRPFTHREAACDIVFLLVRLGLERCAAIGISAGANTLLHVATQDPERIESMVLVSATPRFPEQARQIMRRYVECPSNDDLQVLKSRQSQPGQLEAILKSIVAFADDRSDLNFNADDLSAIRARTLIVQGDRDPLYLIELSRELATAIPSSRLWIVPDGGHCAVLGSKWQEFVQMADRF